MSEIKPLPPLDELLAEFDSGKIPRSDTWHTLISGMYLINSQVDQIEAWYNQIDEYSKSNQEIKNEIQQDYDQIQIWYGQIDIWQHEVSQNRTLTEQYRNEAKASETAAKASEANAKASELKAGQEADNTWQEGEMAVANITATGNTQNDRLINQGNTQYQRASAEADRAERAADTIEEGKPGPQGEPGGTGPKGDKGDKGDPGQDLALPDQSNQGGKFLTTDGSEASWQSAKINSKYVNLGTIDKNSTYRVDNPFGYDPVMVRIEISTGAGIYFLKRTSLFDPGRSKTLYIGASVIFEDNGQTISVTTGDYIFVPDVDLGPLYSDYPGVESGNCSLYVWSIAP